jgi:hypothetical protein
MLDSIHFELFFLISDFSVFGLQFRFLFVHLYFFAFGSFTLFGNDGTEGDTDGVQKAYGLRLATPPSFYESFVSVAT